jgi:mRNA interferase RelE/StbE
MTGPTRHKVIFSPTARRGLDKLPFAIATALYEHVVGAVADNPRRLGKQLDEPLDEVWSTRRGDYRVLYTVDDAAQTITVTAVAHRRDAYRPR